MSNSDSDFADDDEDDEILQGYLTGKTQFPVQTPNQTTTTLTATTAEVPEVPPLTSQIIEKQGALDPEVQAKLFQADGEIAILKAQLLHLQNVKRDELLDLQQSYDALKRSKNAETEALRDALLKLEDDRQFLKNELITSSSLKRRKLDVHADQERAPSESTPMVEPVEIVREKIVHKFIKDKSDASALIDFWRNNFINGAKRSSFEYLSKACFDFDLITSQGFQVQKKQPISSAILEYMFTMRNLRLDEIIEKLLKVVMEVIDKSLASKLILSVPFLVSSIHCIVNFKPAAVTQNAIKTSVAWLARLAIQYSQLLDTDFEEEPEIGQYNEKLVQVVCLEKFVLIELVETTETLVTLASQFEKNSLMVEIWNEQILSSVFVSIFMPQNTERFKSHAQINILYSVVETLGASISHDTFAFNNDQSDSDIISSLMKVLTVDVPMKDGFRYHGLNRMIGNNTDMELVDLAVPREQDRLGNYIVAIPQPIRRDRSQPRPSSHEIAEKHAMHLLSLRIRVTDLFLSLITQRQSGEFLHDKDHFKSILRVIGLEQKYINESPGSSLIGHRVSLISKLVKIVNYLTQDLRDANDLIYTETMYELYVVLSRIAFGADSLSADIFKLLTKIRNAGFGDKMLMFNDDHGYGYEKRERLVNHVVDSRGFSGKVLASAESDFTNGLEFPYEAETVELARDVLNRFVNHEEADNLYFNMNPESDDALASDAEMNM
ncbi:uncharacterized protein LODBEIA_P02120 [Lodderomyces beijingensis]|uniref:DNA damage checkpoint protein LCD1 n=1 Tax=Lodderomyces beijingensis TaxID=1775926 RepID=A0ABP0ZEI5_9ASCO